MKAHSNGFLAIVEDAKSRVREVTVAETMAAVAADSSAIIVDVREESEFTAGHVKGAEHLGKGVLERDIEKLHPDRDQPLYLYCGGGFRSALAADNAQKMGYTRVYSVAGGWRAFLDAGVATEK